MFYRAGRNRTVTTGSFTFPTVIPCVFLTLLPSETVFNIGDFGHRTDCSLHVWWMSSVVCTVIESDSAFVGYFLFLEAILVIADRLKAIREQKNMSQGDIEKRTGLLRCYISRVENGHTVPAIETLEKMARATEVPMYVLFYDGEKPPKLNLPEPGVAVGWGSSGRDAKTLHRFRRLMSRADESDVKLLMFMAQKMARRKRRGNGA
jgi:transcriptional regulator with XRE-family HTH domain